MEYAEPTLSKTLDQPHPLLHTFLTNPTCSSRHAWSIPSNLTDTIDQSLPVLQICLTNPAHLCKKFDKSWPPPETLLTNPAHSHRYSKPILPAPAECLTSPTVPKYTPDQFHPLLQTLLTNPTWLILQTFLTNTAHCCRMFDQSHRHSKPILSSPAKGLINLAYLADNSWPIPPIHADNSWPILPTHADNSLKQSQPFMQTTPNDQFLFIPVKKVFSNKPSIHCLIHIHISVNWCVLFWSTS